MTRILQPGRNCMGLYGANETGILVDSRDYYRAFYDAARKATEYLFITGWQFDSNVGLLQGRDRERAKEDVRFLPFLNNLCGRNSNLEIYILAWDFSVLFALERELFQSYVFMWSSHERIHFRFDSHHPVGASHHEKFVVIDGVFAFLGGMDICGERWDDRNHDPLNPHRLSMIGKPYEPYHDVQSYLSGPVAWELASHFRDRWFRSSGEVIQINPPDKRRSFKIRSALKVSSHTVALSRTQGKTLLPLEEGVQEIQNLYADAIGSAQRLIYFEQQYFSSHVVYQALMSRMEQKGRPKLEIIVILPKRPHGVIEEISIGAAQVRNLYSLREIARRNGHEFGIYYSAAATIDGEVPVYIHSKLLLVDDRFLTVGSANTTNRSLGLDSEINVSWEETDPRGGILEPSLRKIRASLLTELGGLNSRRARRRLRMISGIVKYLDSIADGKICRLRCHTMETIFGDAEILKDMQREESVADPAKPFVAEVAFEILANHPAGFLAKGVSMLSEMTSSKLEPHQLAADLLKTSKGIAGKSRHALASSRTRGSKLTRWPFLLLAFVVVIILLILLIKTL